jgi:hypothetical protein
MQMSVLARLLYNALPREFPGITTVEVTSSLQPQADRQAPGADFATWPKPEDIAMVILFLRSDLPNLRYLRKSLHALQETAALILRYRPIP